MKKQFSKKSIALVHSFACALAAAAPEGVNIKVKQTDEEAVNIYICNAPEEVINWPANHDGRKYAKYITGGSEYNATEYGAQLVAGLSPACAEWSKNNGGAKFYAPIFVGTPSRGFSTVPKNSSAPRNPFAADAAPALRWPRDIDHKTAAIFSALFSEAVAVAGASYLYGDKPRPASLLEIEERFGKDIDLSPESVGRFACAIEVEGFRVEYTPANIFGIVHRYARAFGIGYKAAAVCDMLQTAPAVEVEPLAVEVEQAAAAVEVEQVAPSVEVEPLAVEVEQTTTPAVSLRKACARLIVAALSLIVAGLSVLIAAARLVERGRLFEVIAAALRGRAERVQTVAARRAFVVRGRSGRAVAAVRSSILGRIVAARLFVRGRLDRVQTVAARRAFVIRGRLGRAVAAVRSSALGRIEAARLFVADCLFSARLAYFRRVAAIRVRAVRLINAAAIFLLNLNRVTNRAAARLERA